LTFSLIVSNQKLGFSKSHHFSLTNSAIPGIPISMQWLCIRRRMGTPQIVGFYTLTGEILAVEFRWPGRFFAWHTPISVHIQRRGHTVGRRVYDVTRLTQLFFPMIVVILILIMGQERKQEST